MQAFIRILNILVGMIVAALAIACWRFKEERDEFFKISNKTIEMLERSSKTSSFCLGELNDVKKKLHETVPTLTPQMESSETAKVSGK